MAQLRLDPQIWVGMSQEDRAEYVKLFNQADAIRELLIQHFELKYTRLVHEDESKQLYDSPNLEERRADNRGARRTIREMIDILKGIEDGKARRS